MTSEPLSEYMTPSGTAAAIIIAGALIALAIYTSSGRIAVTTPTSGNQPTAENVAAASPVVAVPAAQPSIGAIRPVAASDHIRGAANAKVTIIEYSDTECPFCKQFQSTMQQVIVAYPNDVRWVYRHSPIDQLHSKARKEAEATECANELGGQKKFWAYLDKLFETTPSNNGLDAAELPTIADQVGLNKAAFTACLNSGKYAQRVADDIVDAQTAGGRGTPYSIIITANEQQPLSGAQPYSTIKQTIDQALAAK